jgi:transposase
VRFFERQIKTVDKAIERELAGFPQAPVLLSIPGFGPVFTAGILAEVQDVCRFASDDPLAKLAGLVWKKHQSGDFVGEETPILHSGNTYLRSYLVQAANSVRMHCAEYGVFYQVKYREATKHHHKRACVLTARKLVRLVYFLLRNNQLYQPPDSRKAAPSEQTQTALPPGELARQIIRRRRAASAS